MNERLEQVRVEQGLYYYYTVTLTVLYFNKKQRGGQKEDKQASRDVISQKTFQKTLTLRQTNTIFCN